MQISPKRGGVGSKERLQVPAGLVGGGSFPVNGGGFKLRFIFNNYMYFCLDVPMWTSGQAEVLPLFSGTGAKSRLQINRLSAAADYSIPLQKKNSLYLPAGASLHKIS